MQQSFRKVLNKVQNLCQREEEELKLQIENKIQFIRCKSRTIKSKFSKNRHSSYEDYNIDIKCDCESDLDLELKEARDKMRMVAFDHMLIYGFPGSLDSVSKFQSTIHISLTPKVATHLNNN
ncbi:hypothetical protein K502DRAFT_368224 [Neoconidiobolus thromboides FSU 785]|nr:hypothetical protein K502DRAFT_368224 [Neoconidiobolus thromboides FSU 785]